MIATLFWIGFYIVLAVGIFWIGFTIFMWILVGLIQLLYWIGSSIVKMFKRKDEDNGSSIIE